jgi:HD-GYP domain-containing protein (c-di-GMP phosphodiesterase class II)
MKEVNGLDNKQTKKLKKGEDLVTSLIDIIAKLTLKNYEQFNDMVKIVMKALNEKDPYTQGHSIRVTEYSLKIGEALGLDKDRMKELELASVLHDIGKLGIPDKILKKPGRLTKEEFEIMRQHSEKGEHMLAGIADLERYKKYVRSHHERYDGFGYPDGLKGEEIPLVSRIIFVADTFDAMTSDRPYRKGLSLEVTIDELIKCSGTQFDPQIVGVFVRIIKEKYLEEEAV